MRNSKRLEKILYIGVIITIFLGLYSSSLYSYLLFHSLIELVTIAIAFGFFILTWHTHQYGINSALWLLGIGYPLIALLDLLHTLAYKGMPIFPGYGANLPTQLWIAARYLQAVTLCAAPFFVERKLDHRILLGVYVGVVSAVAVAIYSGNFPDCYIEGQGLTQFKIYSEYLITTFLIIAAYLFYRKRQFFNNRVFFLLAASIGCTILSELSFTAYLSVYDFANLVGHFAKLVAFYLIYQSILVTGLKTPFDLIFRDLKQAEAALRKAHDEQEEEIQQRTAELRASEGKYRALIECANDAVFIHEINQDGLPGPFIEVNELACKQLGYSREELARLGPLELDDPRYRARIKDVMERLLRDGHAVFETAQMSKDGRSIPVEVSTRILELKETRILFSIVRDITERKRAEEALQSYNQRLSILREIDHRILVAQSFDATAQTVLERFKQLIPCEWARIILYDDKCAEAKTFTLKPAPDCAIPVEVKFAGVSDPVLDQLKSGKSVIAADLKLMEESWSQYLMAQGLCSSLVVPLIAQNQLIGILELASLQSDFFTLEHRQIAEEIASGLAIARYQTHLNSKIAQYNAELEQRVGERTTQLETANRELEAFSYSVSHDLRAPLRAIDGYSGLLLRDYAQQLEPEAQRRLQLIRSNTQQMGQLIDDLLSFSRLSRQPLHKQPVYPAQLVSQVLDELAGGQENRCVEITIGDLASCEGDPALLKLVFANLLSNALKFTRQRKVAQITIGCQTADGKTVYYVQDNGAGFDMQYADKLFGVFQRLHRAEEYEGTGVGLATVQRIIHRHGGRIWSQAEVDQGATFYFTLGDDTNNG